MLPPRRQRTPSFPRYGEGEDGHGCLRRDSTGRYEQRILGIGRCQRGRASLQISPRSSHRGNRRTRFAARREGKGGGLSRQGQAIVQARAARRRYRLGLLNRGRSIQGGMHYVGFAELAAAVSNAGARAEN